MSLVRSYYENATIAMSDKNIIGGLGSVHSPGKRQSHIDYDITPRAWCNLALAFTQCGCCEICEAPTPRGAKVVPKSSRNQDPRFTPPRCGGDAGDHLNDQSCLNV